MTTEWQYDVTGWPIDPATGVRLLGRAEPRLFTPPARQLTRRTTKGFEVIDFARDLLGQPLFPWQEWLVTHALELNPDDTFRFRVIVVLVARQNGKTEVVKVVSLWRLFMDMKLATGGDFRGVLGVAQDLDVARESWEKCIGAIEESPDLMEETAGKNWIARGNGKEYFTLTGNRRYKIAAANRSAGRGKTIHHLNLDELREQRKWDGWSALSKTTMAVPNSQIWAFSNAGDDESVVLNHLREVALSGADPSVFIAEWSGEDDCELDDPYAIAQANPSLGHGTIGWPAIKTALATDPPAVFRTEVLCQRVDTLEEAVSLSAWRALADPAGNLEALRRRLAVCLDVAPDGGHATLAVAGQQQDGRIRVEIAAAWDSPVTAMAELPALLEAIGPKRLAWFPSGPAAGIAVELKRWYEARWPAGPASRRTPFDLYEIAGAEVAQVCQGFAMRVLARQIIHPSDPLLDAQIVGSQRLDVGDGWRFARRGVGHVDSVYAVAGAVHTILTLPEERRARPAVY